MSRNTRERACDGFLPKRPGTHVVINLKTRWRQSSKTGDCRVHSLVQVKCCLQSAPSIGTVDRASYIIGHVQSVDITVGNARLWRGSTSLSTSSNGGRAEIVCWTSGAGAERVRRRSFVGPCVTAPRVLPLIVFTVLLARTAL